jgi:uncharacterized membrane protein
MESLVALLALAVLAVPVLLVLALSAIGTLKARVAGLERRLAAIEALDVPTAPVAPPVAAPPTRAEPGMAQPVTLRAPSLASVAAASARPATPPGLQAASPSPQAASAPLSTAATPPPVPPAPRKPPSLPRPGVFELGLRAIRHWFSVGNVPVKIGMLVLLAGVAALLKYASDQGWLRMPVEFRLAGIALAALAGLVFGWRQRAEKRAFALALQGGAIGVLLLTVFAAFKLYALLPAGAAFALSVVLVAGLGVLAVAQDSRTLAVLGVLAGFLAPIWLSTGSGSHVALFSYYALLNAAIFAIAWLRPWRILNLLGFVFTWGIGTAWGVLQYEPSKFATTEPFLLLFFAFYLALPILYARRRPASRRDLIDGCLVFGTPLVAFSLQAGLLVRDPLDDGRMQLALCALGLAVIYAALAWTLLRRAGYAALGQCHALLAAGFATLAVPLALSARATASVFALEGAGAAWLGLKRARRLPQWSGAGLQLAAALAFAIGASQAVWDLRPVANPTFMGALLVALAGFASAWAYRDKDRSTIATLYYLWALAWWWGDAHNEVRRFVEPAARADVLLAVAAASGWLAAEVHRRRPSPALALTTLAGFLAAIPLAFAQMDAHGSPFAGNGSWAWVVFALLGMRALVCLRGNGDRFAAHAQFAWWLVWPTALSLLAWHLADRFALAAGWARALWVLPWLLVAAVSLFRWPWLAAPQGDAFARHRTPLQSVYFAGIGLWWLAALAQAGNPAPLPWMALLNPLELAQLAALLLLARWLWSPHAPAALRSMRLAGIATAGFVLVTCMTLRSVHHWGGIAWNPGLLSTSLAQASLTVVWSVLGVLGWIVGSRRGQRGLWLAGAVLMGVVLAKLVLVDREHLGNLMGIGSFIAYGLLCTLVGYFAPAPPRSDALDAAGVAA